MKDIVEKAKKGNKKAFSLLFENMKEQMYRTAITYTKDDQDAFDAVQNAVLKAFNKINTLRDNKYFKTWLIRILINECKNILEVRRRIVPMSDEVINYNKTTKGEHNFFVMISSLPQIYIEVIDLRYNHNLKLKSISDVLDIPIGTVKSRLSKAHEILREEYKKEELF